MSPAKGKACLLLPLYLSDCFRYKQPQSTEFSRHGMLNTFLNILYSLTRLRSFPKSDIKNQTEWCVTRSTKMIFQHFAALGDRPCSVRKRRNLIQFRLGVYHGDLDYVLGVTVEQDNTSSEVLLVRNEGDVQKTDANAMEPVKVTYADAVKGKTENKQVKKVKLVSPLTLKI